MATGGPVRELSEELTCPICLEYFRDPVILTPCGHHFCRDCLTRFWGEAAVKASCPLCNQTARPGNLQPNRQLANIVEITKKLSLQGGEARKEEEEARERICEKHREPLKLFCQTDEILICTVCDKSKEHKNHEVVPAEEAAQEYKYMIPNCLKTLRIEREKILAYIKEAEDKSQEMLKRTETQRQERVAEFRALHQLLNEHEKDLLAYIEETEMEIARKRDDHLVRLSEELSSLESLIREMEEKHQQPVSELLQDVRDTLQRYEEKEAFQNPEAFPPELYGKVWNCCDNRFLQSATIPFQEALPWTSPKRRANVILDPASASDWLHLTISRDQKVVEWKSTAQDIPEDPGKSYGFVLGSEGFTAGCHFWEISAGAEDNWAVGVARKPLKGRVTFTPEEGIWAVGRWKGQYKAFTNATRPLTISRWGGGHFRVCLNYDKGQVAFFDTFTAALLYEFSGASFSGEALHPFFAMYGDGWLRSFP